MLYTLILLFLYQLLGEFLARVFTLLIPGPVIGMTLLFLSLLLRGRVSEKLKAGSTTLLQYLSLLFVPVGAGVVLHGQRLADEWLPISVALVGSTLAGLAVTAWVFKALVGKFSSAPPDAEQDAL